MATIMNVSQARASLPQLLDRVVAGDEVTITRHGRPVAVLVRPDILRVRRADDALAAAETVRAVLDRSRKSPLPDRPALSEDRADDLVRDVRATRSGR